MDKRKFQKTGSRPMSSSNHEFEGVVSSLGSGGGYAIGTPLFRDPFIRSSRLGGAMNGDKVRLRRYQPRGRSSGKRGRLEAEVVAVLERARTQWVGLLAKDADGLYLVSDHKHVHRRIGVRGLAHGSRVGDKVLVKGTRLPRRAYEGVEAAVALRLGEAGNHEAETHSLLLAFDVPLTFPKAVNEAAHGLKDGAEDKQTDAGIDEDAREDLRGIATFTIDPADAKDFDDALSVRALNTEGDTEVGIHIADVSHYVQKDDVIDQEAARRSTSIYLVDRTVPMLPERLSNELCSLQPKRDKLCFSVMAVLDKAGKLKRCRFAKTLIHSEHRFTYEEAQKVLDTGEGRFCSELGLLHKLAKQRRKRRFEEGALRLHTPEFQFELDEAGKPLRMTLKPSIDTHFLIEEFMLLANKEVAEYVVKEAKRRAHPLGFVYRVHASPDADKLETLARYARSFGYHVDFKTAIAPHLNQLLSQIEDPHKAAILNTLAVRAMAAAEYSPAENSHFGLGIRHYTHFTSPIRRYPDLVAHRLLHRYLLNQKPNDAADNDYAAQCAHASAREKRASDLERASVKYKQVEYMQRHLGEVREGVVSGLTEWNMYVSLLPVQCEGTLRLDSIGDDYYHFDPKNLCIRGRRKGRRIAFGDRVWVRIVRADLNKRTLVLAWEENPDGKTKPLTGKRKKKRKSASAP